MQRDAIERAASARGDEIEGWYSETWTGGTIKRPVLEQVRADAREGKISRLYVWRIDRLTRSGIRDTLEVIEELRRVGCEVVTISDGFDLHGTVGEIVIAVMAWAAKVERLAINERATARRELARQRGESWGRPPKLSALDLEYIITMHGQGKTVRQIAIALKIGKTVVGRAVKRIRSKNGASTVPFNGNGVPKVSGAKGLAKA